MINWKIPLPCWQWCGGARENVVMVSSSTWLFVVKTRERAYGKRGGDEFRCRKDGILDQKETGNGCVKIISHWFQ
jgi:hypothetical protein